MLDELFLEEYYLKELEELQRKIGYLRQEVSLTNTIINMIKTEQVYDIKDNMLANDKMFGGIQTV